MRHLVAAAVLIGLIAAVYGQTLGHGFVFDDRVLVVENPLVEQPLSALPDLLRARDDGHAFRPLRVFSYMVDYRLGGGLRPGVFHASNLAYHAATALALYALALALLGAAGPAFAAAALFAVHPLGSEAVAYVSGRRDLVCGLGVLLSLLCWWEFLAAAPARGARAGAPSGLRAVWLAGAVLFAALAAAAKEAALVVPLLAALLFALAAARRTGGAGPGALGALLALAAGVVLALLFVYRARIAPTWARLGEGALAPQPALSLTVVGRYAALAVWPASLCADYREGAFPLPDASLDAASSLAASALAAVAAMGGVLLARGRAAGVGLLWFLTALLPVAQLVPYAEVIAEHNAYLPLAGLGLALGDGFASLVRRAPRGAWVALALVLAGAGLRARERAADWRDGVSLWSATVATAPGSIRGRYNLALAYAEAGRLLEARAELERLRETAPGDRDVLVALASVAGRLGDHAVASELAARALEERRDAPALVALGWAQLGGGDARAALGSFEEARALGGAADEAERGLAAARARTGRF